MQFERPPDDGERARPEVGNAFLVETGAGALDHQGRDLHAVTMGEDDLFFVSRNGNIWACWLSGKPAVNLGNERDVLMAMAQAVRENVRSIMPDPQPVQNAQATTLKSAVPSAPPVPPPPPRSATERAATRHKITILGRIFTVGGSREVTILDLSETGCHFHDSETKLRSGLRLTIKLGSVGPIESTVRWVRDESVGIQFNSPLYPSVLEHIRAHFDVRRP